MHYSWSLHIAAIVALHKLITLFHPDFPLPASSYWVPVLAGVLGVLPAFLRERKHRDLYGLSAAGSDDLAATATREQLGW